MGAMGKWELQHNTDVHVKTKLRQNLPLDNNHI